MLTIGEIAALTHGYGTHAYGAHGAHGEATVHEAAALRVTGVSTDSRAIAQDDLFVALVGEHFDGHDYLADVAARGAAAALVSRVHDSCALPCVRVRDTRRALGDLALGWRWRFDLPVIAVTGSNGKTTTKEMIAAILAEEFGETDRLATRGNLNNDIGVPQTLLRLRTHHRAAVVELGMNHPGETARLAEIAAPTVALIVNAQREHQEFMESVAAVAAEHRLAIAALAGNGIAVFPADDAHAASWREAAGARRVVDFAALTDHDADAMGATVVARVHLDAESSIIPLDTPLGATTVRLAVAGLHNARNAAAAAAAAVAADVSIAAIHRGLEAFVPVAGRSQRFETPRGARVIDDSYNANPDSVRAAIDVLAAQPSPRVLILGDMGEVGVAGARFHAEVGDYAREQRIDALFATGAASRETVAAFGVEARHFDDVEALAAAARALFDDAALPTFLVKGSRFMRMERVVAALCETAGETAGSSAGPSNQGGH